MWLGLTIGLHDVHYNSTSFYSENLENGAIADSKEQVKIDGTGFDVKAGVIFRPVEDSPSVSERISTLLYSMIDHP